MFLFFTKIGKMMILRYFLFFGLQKNCIFEKTVFKNSFINYLNISEIEIIQI